MGSVSVVFTTVLSTELSVTMERLYTCAVQCGSHQPHVSTEHLKCGQCDQETKIYISLIFNELKLKYEQILKLKYAQVNSGYSVGQHSSDNLSLLVFLLHFQIFTVRSPSTHSSRFESWSPGKPSQTWLHLLPLKPHSESDASIFPPIDNVFPGSQQHYYKDFVLQTGSSVQVLNYVFEPPI